MATGDKNYDIAKETTSQEILSAVSGGTGVVKHIQRGSGTIASATGSTTITLSGFTNLDKMIVILNGSREPTSTTYAAYVGYSFWFTNLTLNSLTINVGAGSSSNTKEANYSYQVIEFY